MRHFTWFSLCFVLVATGDAVAASFRYVAPKGSDTTACQDSSAPCLTIGHALAVMSDGDTIRIAKGIYKESLTIDTAGTRTFEGGWSVDFTHRDVNLNKATWKGDKTNHRALELEAFGVTNTTIFDGMNMSGSTFPKGSFESGAAIQAFSGSTFPGPVAGSLTLLLNNVTMSGNKSDAAGGAINLQQDDTSPLTLTVTNSSFVNNVAEQQGGAINLFCDPGGPATIDISHSEFDGNDSTDKNFNVGGGAISFFGGCNAALTLTANLFSKNTSKGQNGSGTSGGGAIFVQTNGAASPTLTLVNNVFKGNTTQGNGGAIAVFAASPGSVTLYSRNSTFFSKNHAKFNGGGIWLAGHVTADLLNDIIWGGAVNKGGLGRDLATDGTPSVSINHTDIGNIGAGTPVTDNGGNLSVDPVFVKNTFSPDITSPVLGAGLCTAPSGPPVPADDFFGSPRPGALPGCDIGAVEL